MNHRELKRVRELHDEIPIISNQWALELYTRDTPLDANTKGGNPNVIPRAIEAIFSFIVRCCRRLLML
jgi:hypothetical protein